MKIELPQNEAGDNKTLRVVDNNCGKKKEKKNIKKEEEKNSVIQHHAGTW